MIKAVVFDIGQTLIEYNKPLNWSKSYRPALERAAKACNINLSEMDFQKAVNVLSTYNTRINPREYEVSSNKIFAEIFEKLAVPQSHFELLKSEFYAFFNNETSVFEDIIPVLKQLNANGIVLATLSDVAYGMDNEFALADISEIKDYIQYPVTSNDVGLRKPNTKGLLFLSEKMNIPLSQMVMVGDEEKDIICANNAGVYSVLINRSKELKDFGQMKSIHTMLELPEIVTEDKK